MQIYVFDRILFTFENLCNIIDKNSIYRNFEEVRDAYGSVESVDRREFEGNPERKRTESGAGVIPYNNQQKYVKPAGKRRSKSYDIYCV